MSEWDKVVDFHGHACCILAVGYRAALMALEKIKPVQEEEKLVAIAGTLDCSTDAIQVVLRCTAGSRRLLIREQGKYVFTVAREGMAVRLALKPGILSLYGEDFALLMEKVANGAASAEEREHFYKIQQPLMERILRAAPEDLFNCSETVMELPQAGYNFTPVVCHLCGEEVFSNYAALREGKYICPECMDN